MANHSGSGGANTNKNGLMFEEEVSILRYINSMGKYEIFPVDYAKEVKKNPFLSQEEEETFLDNSDFNAIYKNGKIVFIHLRKNAINKYFFNGLLNRERKLTVKDIVSKQRRPDEAIFCVQTQTLYISEKKFQEMPGSTDEKPLACAFFKKYYTKIAAQCAPHIKVEYGYIFNDWWMQPEYRDLLEHIEDQGCFYSFNSIPEAILKLL